MKKKTLIENKLKPIKQVNVLHTFCEKNINYSGKVYLNLSLLYEFLI